MTASPASLSVLALAGCLLWAGFATTGMAHAAPPLYAFQIPAQPLADALRAYGLITGISVLAPSGALRQRYSSAVQGSLPAPEALQRLLSGTGLQAHFPAANAAIIQLPAGETPATPPLSPENGPIALDAIDAVHADGADYGAYVSGVQAQLLRVLCRSALTRPGSYRLALRLRIAASGSVVTPACCRWRSTSPPTSTWTVIGCCCHISIVARQPSTACAGRRRPCPAADA